MPNKFWKIPLLNPAGAIRLAILGFILCIVFFGGWLVMIRMPGESYKGELPQLTPQEVLLREALQQDVEKLAGEIGRRNYLYYDGLITATNFLEGSLKQAGYEVQRQGYEIDNQTYYNLEVEIPGAEFPEEIVVVGGHYDSAYTSFAANDNGTGSAATLELARLFAGKKPAKTLRFVEFVNEEPPFFQTDKMGSFVYAKRCRDRNENVVAMLSLETMGYYSDEIGSQQYPFPLDLIYPLQGNFIGFVGNTAFQLLVRKSIDSFRRHAQFPSEGAALPGMIQGVGWSDHWAFWQQGYPAVMVTDTAPFRYPYYHTEEDTPDKIDYERLARVVAGLEKVIADLVK
ncbi:M28 family peptidase [Coleofasciculus sp. LEGE 07081]|uniref:M28 family peptidase n=1 Tax=Coleofasciculus sp. LEGE 07081 TaxID=2777967 RepID=UPI0034DB3428